MLPKEIIDNLKTEDGRSKLYKAHIKYFDMVDEHADKMQGGNLLDEFDLKNIQQQLTGCYMKLYIVADTADTVKVNEELDFFDIEAGKLRKAGKKVTVSDIDKQARASSSELRTMRQTFSRYATACEKAIICTQSILKKMTNEKSFKGTDHTG
jgi:hypothetical protein